MNRKWLLTGTTALALIVTPALAANDSISNAVKNAQKGLNTNQANSDDAANPASQTPSKNAQEQSSDNGSPSAANDSASNNPQRKARAMTQEKMRSALKDAGFTQIRVLDAQYLIQATDNDGNTVFMAVNPPSVGNRHDETSGFNSNADADERSASPRRHMNESAEDGESNGRNGGHRGWRNSSADVYNRAFDEGFREGYRRGSNSRGYGD